MVIKVQSCKNLNFLRDKQLLGERLHAVHEVHASVVVMRYARRLEVDLVEPLELNVAHSVAVFAMAAAGVVPRKRQFLRGCAEQRRVLYNRGVDL